MAEVLYHPEVYMPKNSRPLGHVRVSYTKHAMKAANDDRYGGIPTPHILDLSGFSLVELAQEDGRDTKYVLRGALDSDRDVVYVLRYNVGSRGIRNYFVVTMWINLNSDKHRTLDRSKYATARQARLTLV